MKIDNMSMIWSLKTVANGILEICKQAESTKEFTDENFKKLIMTQWLLSEEIKDIGKLSPDFENEARRTEMLSNLGAAIANEINSKI